MRWITKWPIIRTTVLIHFDGSNHFYKLLKAPVGGATRFWKKNRFLKMARWKYNYCASERVLHVISPFHLIPPHHLFPSHSSYSLTSSCLFFSCVLHKGLKEFPHPLFSFTLVRNCYNLIDMNKINYLTWLLSIKF